MRRWRAASTCCAGQRRRRYDALILEVVQKAKQQAGGAATAALFLWHVESSRQELPPDGFAECAFLLMLARRFDADMISQKKLKLSLVLHCCWSGDNAPVQLGVSRLGVGIEACQLKVRDWVCLP